MHAAVAVRFRERRKHGCNIHAMPMSARVCVCWSCLLSLELRREPISPESHFPPPSIPCFPAALPLRSEALGKMKDVYEKNPQMGDPASLASQINQTSQNIERLRGELGKYEVTLTAAAAAAAAASGSSQRPRVIVNIW